MAGDTLSVEDDDHPGMPLLQPVMRGGKRTDPPPALADVRAHAARQLEQLPESLRRLEPGASYRVEVAAKLAKLAAEVDRRLLAVT